MGRRSQEGVEDGELSIHIAKASQPMFGTIGTSGKSSFLKYNHKK